MLIVAALGAGLGQGRADAHGQGATEVAEFVGDDQDGNAASRVGSQVDDLVVAVNLLGITRYGVPVHKDEVVVLVEDVEVVDVQQGRKCLVDDPFIRLRLVEDLLLLQRRQQLRGHGGNRLWNGII